jgi:hypothetical protein
MVSNQMRAGQPVTVQPWFEGQLPGAGKSAGFASTTALLASREASFFTQGLVSSLFDSTSGAQPGLNALRTQLGLQAYDETQVNQAASVVNLGWSNYNALLLTVRHVGPKLTFDLNYTYSKSLDTNQSVQNSAGILANPMVPAVDYAPSRFDHKQIFNALFVYNLPTRYSMLPALLNRIAGGFRVSGIVTALTGAPLFVNEGSQVWGGGQRATYSTPAVPTIAAASIHSGVNASVISPAGVGTAGNPATGGTGLNLFADPQSVYNDFTFVQLSSSVDGSGHPIRGLGYWNVDSSLGKIVKLTEHKSLDLTFDFFNLFNHPNFSTPFLSQTGSTANFGVITNTLVPANRQASSRWIMFSARLEF